MAQIFDPSRFSAIVSRHQEVMRLGERQRQCKWHAHWRQRQRNAACDGLARGRGHRLAAARDGHARSTQTGQ